MESIQASAEQKIDRPANSYKQYLLMLLAGVMAANCLDRVVIGMLLQPIKREFGVSDTELGLLSGLAFAAFYAVMGLPMARWADRGNRVALIATTTAVWSALLALCGAATSFLQLLVIRVGVAIGEAGTIPAAHSLIADYFDRRERPRAVARYLLASPIAFTIGYFCAGFIVDKYGWRATFVAMALPGLALAPLAWFTMKEPRRATTAALQTPAADHPSMLAVAKLLVSNRSFCHLLVALSLWNFFGYGMLQWIPAFFIRSHGLTPGELGPWLALVYGLGGVIGIYLGGELASRFAAGNERLQLLFCAVSFVFFSAVKASAFFVSDYHVALFALWLASLNNVTQGPMYAMLQSMVAAPMRATAIAIVSLCSSLVGMGLGPLAVGILSDALTARFGPDALRYSLALLSAGYLLAGLHLWLASRTVMRDIERVE